MANGPAGQKMLHRTALVIAFVADRRHDGGLAVFPAMHGNTGLLADRGARAVGGDQEPRRDRRAVGKRDGDAFAVVADFGYRGGSQRDAGLARLRFQRGDQESILDHVGERLARLDVAGEGEEHRTHGVVDPAVGHHHVEDRLRFIGDARPDVERLEQTAHGRDEGGRAFVIGVAFAQHRIGDGDGNRPPQSLLERDRQRQPGEAAAGDQDVDLFVAPAHGARVPRRFLDRFVSAA